MSDSGNIQQAACVHLRVSYRTELLSGGQVQGWWECDSGCGAKFVVLLSSIKPPLTQCRAQFVYEAARLAATAARAPVIPAPWHAREADFQQQFFGVIERQCGPDRKTSPAILHADWVKAYERNGWRYGEKYDPDARVHPDMVPYDSLGQLERDKDEVFIALCEIARQWVREEPKP